MVFADVDIEALTGMAIGFGLVVVMPTIALLLAHQRKMAELIRQPVSSDLEGRLSRMQSEIDELRARTAEQTLALDGYHRLNATQPPPPPVRVEA